MKHLGSSSPYAAFGSLLAMVLCVLFALPDFHSTSYNGNTSPVDDPLAGGQFEYTALPEAGNDWRDEFGSTNSILPFEASKKASPCYSVTIDDSLLDDLNEFHSGHFGQNVLDVNRLMTEEFRSRLAQQLSDRTAERSDNCFSGTFVLSFKVNENGELGRDMLTHSISGSAHIGGSLAARAILDLKAEDHRWHDGSLPAGEVRLPVRFIMDDQK